MPTPGLSLVGFMAKPQAMKHLCEVCHPPNPALSAVEAAWVAAQKNLGAPVQNAGHPQIMPIPASEQGHITSLQGQPWLQDAFNSIWKGCTFQLVEVDPLLAFQFTVSQPQQAKHLSGLGKPPVLTELMKTCLPLNESTDRVNSSWRNTQSFGAQSIILKPTNLNFKILQEGLHHFQTPYGNQITYLGLQVGWALPHVQVVRFHGKHYLHNGFHRAVALRMAGATHIPCIVRDVATPEEAGISTNTFDLALLESTNPPTLQHFTSGRAHSVSMRTMTRVIQVNWSEHVMLDD